MCFISSCQDNANSSRVLWTPTMEDVLDKPDIKMIIFFREDPMLQGKVVDRLEEIGRLTDPAKVENVMESIEEYSKVCGEEDDCAHMYMWPTWMGVVNKNNQGLLINVGWNHINERVEWWGRYSNQLYEVLVEYGIIKPPKQPIFLNDPNMIKFKIPKDNFKQKKPRVITTFRERDLENFYIKVDPNTTPVYVQVDPNSPAVYVAIDSGSMYVLLKELLLGINLMKNASEELMAQNRWLKNTLNRCLKKLEAEKGLQAIVPEPKGYMNNMKPVEPNALPYVKPQEESFPEIPDITRLGALINLHCLATNSYIYSTRENIKSLESRIERLETRPGK